LKILLDETAAEWQLKARRFAEEELIPFEVEAEMNGGALPDDVRRRHKKMAWLCARSIRWRYGSSLAG